MIGRLLRRDPMLAAQGPVILAVAALTGLLGSLMMRVVTTLQEMGSTTDRASGVALVVTASLAGQAVLLSAVFCMGGSFKRDGMQPFARCRPMDLTLPIPPRAAWCARLIAHGIAIAVPLLTVYFVSSMLGQPAASLSLWKVAVASATVVLFVFGLAPGEAVLRGRRALLSVVAVMTISATLMFFDLGAFQDDALTSYRFGTDVVLVASAVWALLASRRLPSSWGLPAERSRSSQPELTGRLARTAPPTSAWGRQWAVTSATICPLRRLFLSLAGFAVIPLVWFSSEAWVAATWAAWLLATSLLVVLTDAQFLSTLPISRRRLLLVTLSPLVLSMALGCLVVLGLDASAYSMRPVVTLDRQLEKRSGLAEVRPYHQYDGWLDVVVPLRHWRLAGSAGIPSQVSPSGERVTPRAVHPLGLSFLTVYNPYDAPLGSSQSFTAWQFSRAMEAEHGVSLDPSALSERYLQTNRHEQVEFSKQQVARNLAEREAEGRPWYGTLGTLTYDHPETAARWDARRAALPILAALLGAILLGRLMLCVRAGTRTHKVMSAVLPTLFLLAFALDTMLGLWFGPGHPQVLFAIAGEALLSWLPESAVFVWALTAGVSVAGFFILAKGLDRAEVLGRRASPLVGTLESP